MQNKGAIRLVAILLLLACIWQLSFTAVTKIQENKAEKYAEQIAAQAVNDDECAMMSEAEKADYIAEVAKSSNRAYIDSLSAEKGIFSYKSAKAKEINLGLDLKGGMNVILEVSIADVLRNTAGADKNVQAKVDKAIQTASENVKQNGGDLLDEFVKAYGENIAGAFASNLEGITPSSSSADVKAALVKKVESAVANANEVIRTRIDRFGVALALIHI